MRQSLPFAQATLRFPLAALLFAVMFAIGSTTAQAQQPFVTDDADATPRRRFHIEVNNQFAWLPRSAFPALRQNIADVEFNYGLFEGVEIGIIAPLASVFNAPETLPRNATGIGDASLSLKYNFYKERGGSWLPAMAVTFAYEAPTGEADRALGSGLTDYHLNVVFQKSLTDATTVRVNGGALFAGLKTAGEKTRGTVGTGGVSLVRTFTERLRLGAEVAGAATPNSRLGRAQLQAQVGGNYAVGGNCTLDFGIIAGRFSGSPRLGVQLGFSVDF